MISASVAIPQYLDAIRLAKKADNTQRTYRHALRTFTRILGKNDELSEKNFIKLLQSTAHLSARTQNTYRVPVARLYEYYAPGIPVKLLIEQYGQKSKKSMIKYNEAGVDKVIEYALTLWGDLLALRDRAFILTGADTGIRISEACSLLRKDIDFERGRAIIIGKGDKPGVVRFSPRSLQAIRDYQAARAELDGKSGRPLGSLPLFARHDPGAGKKVKPVGYKGMGEAFSLRVREAGITEEDEAENGPVTFHKLRHRFGTVLIRAGKPVTVVKILMRHEDINTTMGYTHFTDEEADLAYLDIFDQ